MASHRIVPGVPARTYVNMVLASRHEANTVYAAFNNHKNGDFKPYLLKSTDAGSSWRSIASNLPERGSVYSIAEDPEVPDLLFVGTEFGAWFTRDGGAHWVQLTGGLPTIAVRDLAIQTRENDLVLATFGRGFWVLDDYTPLRTATSDVLASAAHLFPVTRRPAVRAVAPARPQRQVLPGGIVFHGGQPALRGHLHLLVEGRHPNARGAAEGPRGRAQKAGQPPGYPSFEEMRAEDQEQDPYLLFTIRDERGDVVRRLTTAPHKGIQRIAWDLRYPATVPVDLSPPGEPNPFSEPDVGPFVVPGTYTVSMAKVVDGVPATLVGPTAFQVVPLNNATLVAEDKAALLAFQKEAGETQREILAASQKLGEASNRLRHIREAIRLTTGLPDSTLAEARALERQIAEIRIKLNGDGSVARRQFETPPSIMGRIGAAVYSSYSATSAPSPSQREQVRIAQHQFQELEPRITELLQGLESLEAKLQAAGAPYTPGRAIRR